MTDPEFLSPEWHRMIAGLHMADGPCGCKSCNLVRAGKVRLVPVQLSLFGGP